MNGFDNKTGKNQQNYQIEVENLSFIYENTYKKNIKEKMNSSSVKKIQESKEIEEISLEKIKVLRKNNLKISKGKFIALCGNTGSGKSTFVRTFNGLIPHFYNGQFYGYVRILGKDTINETISDLSLNVGLVFQNPENQLVALTVEKEIAFGLENRGVSPEIIKKKITEILDYLGIQHLRTRHPFELSGGEQQRVAIASILALEPEIIILDEPTSALDPKATLDIVKLLKMINIEKKITVIIIEHRLDVILSYCDEIIVMNDGKILQHGSVREVLNAQSIWETEIQIPKYIESFHFLKNKGLYEGDMPQSLDDAAKILEELLSK